MSLNESWLDNLVDRVDLIPIYCWKKTWPPFFLGVWLVLCSCFKVSKVGHTMVFSFHGSGFPWDAHHLCVLNPSSSHCFESNSSQEWIKGSASQEAQEYYMAISFSISPATLRKAGSPKSPLLWNHKHLFHCFFIAWRDDFFFYLEESLTFHPTPTEFLQILFPHLFCLAISFEPSLNLIHGLNI